MYGVAWVCLGLPVGVFVYAYLVYPGLLYIASRFRKVPGPSGTPETLPLVSITVPAYNEADNIAAVIESLLALDYPAARRQILVVSDGSSDGTDDIVRSYADRGVELHRTDARGGKTAAENAAAPLLRGIIVVNTDASIRILPHALKPLIAAFDDPSVGVASGRDRSVGSSDEDTNRTETGYVGYEMWIRSLETRLGTIIGASGCFYAIRRALHGSEFPPALSRDFAAALIAITNGYRAVSVDAAVCLVPRTASLRTEFRRKIRTMERGLETLWHMRACLNPFRFPLPSAMLFSHKIARWSVPLLIPVGLVGLALLAPTHALAALGLAGAGAAVTIGALVLLTPERRWPRPLLACAYLVAGVAAGLLAWFQAVTGRRNAIWEPTRRPAGPIT